MRIVIILIFGILSYLLVFLPGYFLFFPEGSNFFIEKELPLTKLNEKKKNSPLKNPGKEPPPK